MQKILISSVTAALAVVAILFMTQGVWRDRDYLVKVGTVVPFDDGNGRRLDSPDCLEPSYGLAEVLAVRDSNVLLKPLNSAIAYSAMTNRDECQAPMSRSRHWVKVNLERSPTERLKHLLGR